MKRAQSSAFGTIFALVLIAVTLVVVFVVFFPTLFSGGEQFQECSGYCSYSCDEIVTGYRFPTGDAWCENGIWNLGSFVNSEENSVYKEKIEQKGLDATKVVGDTVGLRCCNVLPKKKPPLYFLTKDLRDDEVETDGDGGGRRTDVINPPRISAFFGDDSLPLRNGELVEVYSNKEANISFLADYVKCTNKDCTLVDGKGEEISIDGTPVKKICSVKLIDEDGDDLIASSGDEISTGLQNAVCDGLEHGNANPVSVPIEFSSQYEGKIIELQLLITEIDGKYKPTSSGDTKFILRIKVDNPILIGGLTSAYTREKHLTVSCRGSDCQRFFYAQTNACSDNPLLQTMVQSAPLIKEVDYDSEIQGKGKFTLTESSERLCVYAFDKTGKAYTRESSLPIHIDRTSPLVDAKFHAFPDMYTTITCTDTGGAGCTASVGYHYISRPVDFIGALFSGFKDPKKCPSERAAYNFMRVDQESGDGIIPFYSSHDFMVLCVMVEDNAGNNARDILLTYNSWEILEAIAGDQLGQGGIGTGYTGYNFWS